MNNSKFSCYAATSFGLESVTADELKLIGAQKVTVENGKVYFSADKEMIVRANCRLLTADRVYIILSKFIAKTFDEIFENIKKIKFGNYLPQDADILVTGDAVRSQLMSVSDIQSIGKKAVIESIKRKYGDVIFVEDGPKFNVYIQILNDNVIVALNTSGAGLNRRGYRKVEMAAPLRENLAAGLIKLTRWSDRPFYDIMCGSGTIVIEAAMMARRIIPGLLRRFASEYWDDEFKKLYIKERASAKSNIVKHPGIRFYAYDIDRKAIDAAKVNSKAAYVSDMIHFGVRDAKEFKPETNTGTVISNPPYAMRMGSKREVETLYKELGKRFSSLPDFKCYFIAADEEFEAQFGRKSDKKRKLYNGNSKCFYYQYYRTPKTGNNNNQ